jgi:hypothetical protein
VRSLSLFTFAFVGILFASIFLRFWKLGQVPYSLYWDEQAMLVDVKSVAETGRDMHNRPWYQVLYPSYGDYKLPVYIWFATASSKLFGVNEFSLRFPSAVAGVGTVVLSGLIAKEFVQLKKKKLEKKFYTLSMEQLVQLSTMVVVTVSPWAIGFSRTGFEGHVGQMLLAISVLLMLRSRQKWWLILPAAVVGSFATYAYFSVRFVWIVVFAVVMALVFWVKRVEENKITAIGPFVRKNLSWVFGYVLLPVLLFGVLLLPMMKSPLYADSNAFRLGTDSVLKNDKQVMLSNVYREMAGNSRLDRIIFHRWWLTAQELFKNYSDHLSLDFLFVSGDPNLRHGTGQHGLFPLMTLPFFFVGMYMLWKEHRGVWGVVMIWWLIALLPASVPENTPHALRSLNALVPLSIMIGFGVAYSLVNIHAWKNVLKKKFVYTLLIVVFLLSTLSYMYHYFVVYPKISASDWQDGYKQTALEIYKNMKPGESFFILPFDDRFYLWLMAYGPYTGHDFQSWKSEKYQFNSFPQITFGNIEGTQINQLSQPVTIVGKKEQVEKLLLTSPIAPSSVVTVNGGDGTQRFMLARFGKL